MWLKKYPDGGKVEKPKPKFNIKNDPLRPKGLGVQMQDNTRPIPVIDRIKVHKEIQNRVALAKINSQPQLKQAVTKNLYEQKLDLAKKEAYATSQPNAKLVNGQLEEINPGYKMEGQPFGPNEKRFEKGLSHLVGGVEATTYLTGVGELAGMAKPVLKQAAKYLTEQTALKNAYKVNPFAFKPNPEAYYHRSPNLENTIVDNKLVGFGATPEGKLLNEEGIKKYGKDVINLTKAANNEPYFSKGVPLDWGRYNKPNTNLAGKAGQMAQGYKGPYLAEATDVPFVAKTDGKFAKVWNKDGTFKRGIAPNEIGAYATPVEGNVPLENLKFYKENWLKGYKEIPKNKPGEVWWNGKNYQNTPPSSQEVLSTSSGMDAVNVVKPGYNSHLFNKQAYVPPTTDPSLMAYNSGYNQLSEESLKQIKDLVVQKKPSFIAKQIGNALSPSNIAAIEAGREFIKYFGEDVIKQTPEQKKKIENLMDYISPGMKKDASSILNNNWLNKY